MCNERAKASTVAPAEAAVGATPLGKNTSTSCAVDLTAKASKRLEATNEKPELPLN